MFLSKRQYEVNHPNARKHQIQRKDELVDNSSFHFPGNNSSSHSKDQENKNPNNKNPNNKNPNNKNPNNKPLNSMMMMKRDDTTELKDIHSRLTSKVQEAKEK